MRVEHLRSIKGAVLVVNHTDQKCYQYSILFWDGSISTLDGIFYTADKALEMGIEAIETKIGYR